LNGGPIDGKSGMIPEYFEAGSRSEPESVSMDDAERKSLALLEAQVDEFPHETSYRFELMQTLAEINVVERGLELETQMQALERPSRGRLKSEKHLWNRDLTSCRTELRWFMPALN
jgi:hypothetical protein